MALFKYLRPSGGMLDSQGPTVPTKVLEEVNKEVSKAVTRGKKRGAYSFFSPEQKAKVAKYTSTHGVRAAVICFLFIRCHEIT